MLRCRVIVGDLNSTDESIDDANDLPSLLANNVSGVEEFPFECDINSSPDDIEAYGYKTLFFANFSAQDTNTLIQRWDEVNGKWENI